MECPPWSSTVNDTQSSLGLFELGAAVRLGTHLPGLVKTEIGDLITYVVEVGPWVAERGEGIGIGHRVEPANAAVMAEHDVAGPRTDDGAEQQSGLLECFGRLLYVAP